MDDLALSIVIAASAAIFAAGILLMSGMRGKKDTARIREYCAGNGWHFTEQNSPLFRETRITAPGCELTARSDSVQSCGSPGTADWTHKVEWKTTEPAETLPDLFLGSASLGIPSGSMPETLKTAAAALLHNQYGTDTASLLQDALPASCRDRFLLFADDSPSVRAAAERSGALLQAWPAGGFLTARWQAGSITVKLDPGRKLRQEDLERVIALGAALAKPGT